MSLGYLCVMWEVTDQITEDVLDESFEGFVDEGLRGGW